MLNLPSSLDRWKRLFTLVFISVLMVLSVQTVIAQSTSNSYRIEEDTFSTGGDIESQSSNYKSESTTGDLGVGNSNSTSYQTNSGYNTNSEPRLAFSINSSSVSLGKLSTSVASTATSTFSVLNYTAYGYIVQIIGNTPSNGNHNLTAMSSTSASNVGTEQYGINVVRNTDFCGIGCHLGADPVQTPSSSFSFGEAAGNYDTDGNFRYVSGETIAEAPKSSGQTDYTVSYIANSSVTTPSGSYSGSHTLVCVGTY
jgi:hypothetical protein